MNKSGFAALVLKNRGLQFIEHYGSICIFICQEKIMPFSIRFSLIVALLLLVFLSGCQKTPVRHLASDAALIEAGNSSRSDVLAHLGEPDGQRLLADGSEEWFYIEKKKSRLQALPLVGGFFDEKGRDTIVLVLQGNTVRTCSFIRSDTDEFDWAEDYSWQEKKE